MIGLISQVGYVVAYATVGGFVDFIISPFLQESGNFSQVILALIGKGEGRSAALMIIIAGVFLVIVAWILPHKNEIRELEEKSEESILD